MKRPELLAEARGQVSWVEYAHLAFARRTFTPGVLATGIRWLQNNVGRRWIDLATRNLRHIHHTERLPASDSGSCIIACNHRSFFDLYVVTVQLIEVGMRQRILFPVRANFFYDNPAGAFVNGAMSFFAMYPPMFRDRARAGLNMTGLDEVAWLLRQGGYMAGFHPEGTRNKGNPYELLPARTGIGRLAHKARVPVVPVFTNGLLPDDLRKQIRSNFDGSGVPIHTVVGAPVQLDDLYEASPSQGTYKQIANRVRDALVELAKEEAELRARYDAGRKAPQPSDAPSAVELGSRANPPRRGVHVG